MRDPSGTWKQTFDETTQDVIEHVKQVEPTLTQLRGQIGAAWRASEPSIRAWVAAADRLTEQEWRAQPEEMRQACEQLKALLREMDDMDDEGQQGAQ